MQDTYTLKENMHLCFFGLVFMLIYLNFENISIIVFFLVVNMLFVGNLRHLRSEKFNNSNFFLLLRRSFYIIPLVLPYIILPGLNLVSYFKTNILFLFIGFLIGLILILPKWKTWNTFLSNDFLIELPKRRKIDVWVLVFVYFFGAIFEELFYRLFIYQSLIESPFVLTLIISTLFFLFHHYATPWGQAFKTYDFIIQILISIISMCFLYFTNSIIPSLVLHLTYNGPHILMYIKYLLIHREMGSVNIEG
ncbi:CPBP family intramembrane glutamic endopeptidase [Caldifermentibacillus hisashii]|uniref:CPBP family intramembrane glutamic endopeptidase n=1 Tax=Caldifermentibacillus hisashii TaxID=996558 RepID=UPI0031FC3032